MENKQEKNLKKISTDLEDEKLLNKVADEIRNAALSNGVEILSVVGKGNKFGLLFPQKAETLSGLLADLIYKIRKEKLIDFEEQ